MIKVKNISNDYILNDVSFEVSKGQLVCVVGESGSGKSTLLNTIAGFEVPNVGSVYLRNEDVTSLNVQQRKVGMVFQTPSLFGHMTVGQNLRFANNTLTTSEQEALLARVGLQDYRQSWPHELSVGQQQLVALLRAIAYGADVILLDEPFANLDITLRQQLRTEMLTLLKQEKITALMVTHDCEDALAMADHIIVMDDGAIIQQGTSQQLFERPETIFVAKFFGPVQILNKEIAAFFGHHMPEEGILIVRDEDINVTKDEKSGYMACLVDNCTFQGKTSLLYLSSDVMQQAMRVQAVCGGDIPSVGDTVFLNLERVMHCQS